jgi:hypothetical protein
MLAILLALTCGTELWTKKILTDPGAAAALAPAPIMIVEFPHPGCAAGSPALAAIKRARKQAQALMVGQHVRLTGMLFFDKPHVMIGNAPNYAELHPVFKAEPLP